jgi:hypothetical protein
MTFSITLHIPALIVAITAWALAGYLFALGWSRLSEGGKIHPDLLRYLVVVTLGPVMWLIIAYVEWSEMNWSGLYLGRRVFVYRWPGAALSSRVSGVRIGTRRTGIVLGFKVADRA